MAATWLELIDQVADPKRAAYIFLNDQGQEIQRLTWAELRAAVAERTEQLAALKGPVLLVFETGPDFIVTCLACFQLGLTAIPAPPLDPSRLMESAAAMKRTMEDANVTTVLASGKAHQHLHQVRDSLGEEPLVLDVHTLAETSATRAEQCAANPGDVTCMLYTSGSTAQPKGVALTRDNLVYNGRTCAVRWRIHSESVLVSWMPHHHSFGLVFNLLVPICSGATTVLFSPTAFLYDPGLWLRAIDQYRATHSAGATFAYRYCVDRLDQAATAALDFSCWRVGLIAAEPVYRSIYESFLTRFKDNGLAENFFCVLYGLSETGPITSMPAESTPVFHTLPNQPDAMAPACVGRSFPGTSIRVVDPSTSRVLPTGESGEIWVQGPSLMAGYHGRSEDESFFIENISRTRWFRTGDLGFFDEDRRLYVTGRIKEVIIYRGKNHYPQDIEWAAADVDWVENAVALGLSRNENSQAGELQLTLVAEMAAAGSEALADRASLLRTAVLKKLGLGLHRVVMVEPGTIPTTRSGKNKRSLCSEAILAGTLQVLADIAFEASVSAGGISGLDLEASLLQLIKAEAQDPEIDAETRLGELGLDSMQWVSLAEKISAELNIACHPSIFFKADTVADLGALLAVKPSS